MASHLVKFNVSPAKPNHLGKKIHYCIVDYSCGGNLPQIIKHSMKNVFSNKHFEGKNFTNGK